MWEILPWNNQIYTAVNDFLSLLPLGFSLHTSINLPWGLANLKN